MPKPTSKKKAVTEVPIGGVIPYVGRDDDTTQNILNTNGWWICNGNPNRPVKAPGTPWDNRPAPDLTYRFLVGYFAAGIQNGKPNSPLKARVTKPIAITTKTKDFDGNGTFNGPPSMVVQPGANFVTGGQINSTGTTFPDDVDITVDDMCTYTVFYLLRAF